MNVYQEQEDKPLQDTAPRPRLCHVTKWDHFDGYGFNLHAEKSRPGQYIGKVDESSPAEKAGLKEGDRIIEVNGVNINHENHKQVVSRIKASPNETRLLVVDAEAENFYKDNDIVIHGELSNVLRMSSEPGPAQGVPIIVETIEIENHNEPDGPSPSSMAINTTTTTTTLNNYSRNVRQNSVEDDDQHSNHSAMSAGSSTAKKTFGSSVTSGSSPRSSPSPEPPLKKSSPHPLSNPVGHQWGGLDLSMTAAEMRSKIGSRKKRDPRRDDRMDFRKKYEIIETL